MATFQVKKETLLEIIQSGQSKLKEQITKSTLDSLKNIVEKWNHGFTEKYENFQYTWDGEITVENYELKRDDLPYKFTIDFANSDYTYNETDRSNFNKLNKWLLIATFATGDLTMNDEEFCLILNLANYKP